MARARSIAYVVLRCALQGCRLGRRLGVAFPIACASPFHIHVSRACFLACCCWGARPGGLRRRRRRSWLVVGTMPLAHYIAMAAFEVHARG